MRWATRAITTLSALACALACGGGGGGSSVDITTTNAFPQGFLPQLLAGSNGSGDVVFRAAGDLFVVGGGSADVTAISRADGAVSTFANDVGGGGNSLLSLAAGSGTDARLFAGDVAGRIWAIAANGAASLLIDTGSEPITGLAIAPTEFGNFAGSLFAAAGDGGILRITTDDPATVTPFFDPAESYADVAFSGSTLFALDVSDGEVDTIAADGSAATTLQDGFDAPVGIAVDSLGGEIYVADAGDDVLRSFPVAGGTVTDRAVYDFDPDAPSGLAYDGIGALAFVTNAPFAVRGSALPRIDPANPTFGLFFAGPTTGFGDLELDRLGAFVFVANDTSAAPNNFVFSVSRDANAVTVLASGVPAGGTPERLLGLAIDPVTQSIYFGSDAGTVYRRTADGTVSELAQPSSDAVLGLEQSPLRGDCTPGGPDFDGCLVATTDAGEVIAIDPEGGDFELIAQIDGTSLLPALLSDLVFASDGTLYVLDNGQTTPTPGDPRILIVEPDGGVDLNPLGVDSDALERPDGIELDEGGDRLLVAADGDLGDLLLAVALGDGDVTPLANIDVSDGFFPSGVVYDRLGTAVVRVGEAGSALDASDVSP